MWLITKLRMVHRVTLYVPEGGGGGYFIYVGTFIPVYMESHDRR